MGWGGGGCGAACLGVLEGDAGGDPAAVDVEGEGGGGAGPVEGEVDAVPAAGAARGAQRAGVGEQLVLDGQDAAGAEGEDGADAVVGVGEEEDARLVVGALGADAEGEEGWADAAEVPAASPGPVAVDLGVAHAAAEADAARAVQRSRVGDPAAEFLLWFASARFSGRRDVVGGG